jgi:hypothetical protein
MGMDGNECWEGRVDRAFGEANFDDRLRELAAWALGAGLGAFL